MISSNPLFYTHRHINSNYFVVADLHYCPCQRFALPECFFFSYYYYYYCSY